MAGVSRRVV